MDRRLWTPEEDQHIMRLVTKFGTKKWPLISERLCAETEFERTGKQCRQRWYNHLSPEISSAVWSQQDEQRLFEAHKEHGNRWKVISKLFEGRTDNSIKNHFYSTIRRCLRRINKLQGQKNSTLKMRSIKPYVLSKILADRNLTETILQLGKIKPNKSRRELKFQYFQEFNQMINKLYEINSEYQMVKCNKKQLVDEKLKEKISASIGEPSGQAEEAEDQLPSDGEEQDLEEEDEDGSPKKENRTSLNIILKEMSDPLYKIKRVKKDSPTLRRRRSVKINRPEPTPSYQPYKQIKLQEQKDSSSSRRPRKAINYMKLNEGILCETQRHHQMVEETHQDSESVKKKEDFMGSDEHMSLEEKLFGREEKLLDIIEEEQKSNDKENPDLNRSLLYHDQSDMKGLRRHFEISHPSPSYSKSTNFFDDLVIIGTHMKILSTPQAHSTEKKSAQDIIIEQFQRKQSQDEFIEQILQINFDPQFALKFGAQEEQK